MTIGEFIRNRRKELNLTQKQLGEKSGIARITIRYYESEKIKPKVHHVMKLTTALDVPVEEFLKLH